MASIATAAASESATPPTNAGAASTGSADSALLLARVLAWAKDPATRDRAALVRASEAPKRARSGWTFGELAADAARVGHALSRTLHARAAAGSGASFADADADALEATPLVGIMVHDVGEAVCAFLGAWSAGCGFIAIEPTLPAARIEVMVGHCRAGIVGGGSDGDGVGGVAPLPLPDGAPVLHLDTVLRGSESTSSDAATLPGPASPESCAFCLFTSGSTGAPMPVRISHRAEAHMVRVDPSNPRVFGLDCAASTTVGVHRTSAAWVDGMTELWCNLSEGVRLVLADRAQRADAGALLDLLRSHGVSHMLSVPSQLRALIAADGGNGGTSDASGSDSARWELLPDLAFITTSGEALDEPLLAQLRRALPRATIQNTYGTSEVCGDATVRVFPPVPDSGVDDGFGAMPEVSSDTAAAAGSATTPARGANASSSPVGTAVPGVTLVMLDRAAWGSRVHTPASGDDDGILEADYSSLPQVPAGTPGEACFIGATVAQGYSGFAEATARKFVCVRGAPGAAEGKVSSMFCTGDVGVVSPSDGALWLMGRVDHQVKLRGQRVNVAEVEGTLGRTPGVAEVAVVARDTGVPGLKRLVAYAVPQDLAIPADDGAIATFRAAVAEFAASQLPEFMRPAIVVPAGGALPQLYNRKVDRRRLKAMAAADELRVLGVLGSPVQRSPRASGAEVATATPGGDEASPLEAQVARIWVSILFGDAADTAVGSSSTASGGSGVTLPPDADWFALGGDSIASVMMLRRVGDACRMPAHHRISMQQLAEAPRLRAFAAAAARVADAARSATASVPTHATHATATARSGGGDDDRSHSDSDADTATGSVPGFTVRRLREADGPAVVRMLATEFVSREVITVAMRVPLAQMEALAAEAVQGAIAVGVGTVAIENGSGRVIAASVNVPLAGPDEPPPAVPPSLQHIFTFLGAIEQRYVAEELAGALPEGGVLDMLMTGVAADVAPEVARDAGVLSLAVDKESLRLAREAGFARAFTIATHPVTQHQAEYELGFRVCFGHTIEDFCVPEGPDAGTFPFRGKLAEGDASTAVACDLRLR